MSNITQLTNQVLMRLSDQVIEMEAEIERLRMAVHKTQEVVESFVKAYDSGDDKQLPADRRYHTATLKALLLFISAKWTEMSKNEDEWTFI